MGSQREKPLTTEEFAYDAAVALHVLCEILTPLTIEWYLYSSEKFTGEEAKVLTDEAYRRRLE